jgi:hypothetical protein
MMLPQGYDVERGRESLSSEAVLLCRTAVEGKSEKDGGREGGAGQMVEVIKYREDIYSLSHSSI